MCTTALPLLLPSVVALRISSTTPLLAFQSPSSSIRSSCSSTICYASQLDETLQSQVSPPEEAPEHSSTEQQHSPSSVSPKIVQVDTSMDSVLHHNGHSQPNGYHQPLQQHPQLEIRNGAPVNDKTQSTSIRKLWQRRHARSIEEGVRFEKTQKTTQLSTILSKETTPKRRYFARTISGLIHALAEEADGLDVDVDAQQGTPLWRKQVDAIRINFSRLGFKPLRMGGLDEVIRTLETQISGSEQERLAENLELAAVSSADEAFDRIDQDKSGALDREELAKALTLAASSDSDEKVLDGLASQLVQLYDVNGDGVVDREEYQRLVTDMAALRQEERDRQQKRKEQEENPGLGLKGLFGRVFGTLLRKQEEIADDVEEALTESSASTVDTVEVSKEVISTPDGVVNISDDAAVNSVAKGGGSIVLSDLTLDLRQLLFGFVPIVKQVSFYLTL